MVVEEFDVFSVVKLGVVVAVNRQCEKDTRPAAVVHARWNVDVDPRGGSELEVAEQTEHARCDLHDMDYTQLQVAHAWEGPGFEKNRIQPVPWPLTGARVKIWHGNEIDRDLVHSLSQRRYMRAAYCCK